MTPSAAQYRFCALAEGVVCDVLRVTISRAYWRSISAPLAGLVAERALGLVAQERHRFRRGPAMAPGLTDHVWTLEEIIGLLDQTPAPA